MDDEDFPLARAAIRLIQEAGANGEAVYLDPDQVRQLCVTIFGNPETDATTSPECDT